MNDFFVGLRVLFGRLHVVFAIVLLAWEVMGQNTEGADTPIRIVAIISNYSIEISLAILITMLLGSYFFWSYILGSFIRKPLISEKTTDSPGGGFFVGDNPLYFGIDFSGWILTIIAGIFIVSNIGYLVTL